MTRRSVPISVSDRFAVTPYLPFPILGPRTRSTNSDSVTDHGAINNALQPDVQPRRQFADDAAAEHQHAGDEDRALHHQDPLSEVSEISLHVLHDHGIEAEN